MYVFLVHLQMSASHDRDSVNSGLSESYEYMDEVGVSKVQWPC